MVAIRQTHEATFDFGKWIESLDLSQESNELLHKTHDFVMSHIDKKDKEKKVPVDRTESVKNNFIHLSSEIVGILMMLNMDLDSLQVSILYPAFENGYVSKTEVLETFGEKIEKLLLKVRDMEAIRFLQNLSNGKVSETQVDRVRRMLLAMVDDVRAVVIKLAERIAVIRAASQADMDTKTLIAREISNIYAPLANRLGIGQLKWELEDLAFKFLHPEEYMEIAHDLGERRVEREKYISNFVEELSSLLNKENIHAKVYGRPKHIYSIWRKMQRKHLPFNELYDVRAVRVLVDKIPDCYAVLAIVHARWKHIQREFDDYIANPKPNGYQSVHTVVYGDGDKVVEIQIRTERMHNMAENGVAAHWKYKEGGGQSSGAEQRIDWLRKLLSWRDDLVESGALLEDFKKQVFEDRVYVFTPQGEVVDLPTGATPLDFAYQVHTMIGHRCIGAKVDGRIVPFTYHLKTGEQVEIITQKNPNPSRDWLNADNGFLKTSRARSKVQSWFRKVDYDKNRQTGEDALVNEIIRHKWSISKDQLYSLLKDNLKHFNMKTVDDLFAGIGVGDIGLTGAVGFIGDYMAKRSDTDKEEDLSKIISAKTVNALAEQRKRKKSGIIVDGVSNLVTHISKCCQPIPGDDIVGFITHGRGISIHRSDCEQLKRLIEAETDRMVKVSWGDTDSKGYSVTIRVIGQNYSGFLRDITTVIANEKMNVLGLRSRVARKQDLLIIDIDLMIGNAVALDKTIKAIRAMSLVNSAERL